MIKLGQIWVNNSSSQWHIALNCAVSAQELHLQLPTMELESLVCVLDVMTNLAGVEKCIASIL